MEKLKQQVEALDIQEQQQLIVDLIVRSAPDVQLSLLLPAVTAATKYVKWRLVTNLQGQETPDILQLLPPEIQQNILFFLDGPSLLRAIQVSKTWESIIRNHNKLWLKKCRLLGVNMNKIHEWEDWHKVYVTSLRQQVSLKNGTAFSERLMQLQNCKKAVKAVDYRDGFLCTVSEEDYINIWQLDMNIPIMTFPVERAVSSIKFQPNSLLLCGHFMGILTSWDLSTMNRSRCSVWEPTHYMEHDNLKKKFTMHTGPVFCVDFSEELDLVVSGGADDSLKLWSLTTGLKVWSVSSQDHWVLRVVLIPDLSMTCNHEIIFMTREFVKKISWPSVVKCDSDNSVKDKGASNSDKQYGMLEKIALSFKISLGNGSSNFFTPGLQLSSKYIAIIKQDVEEKNADLCIFDIKTFKLAHSIALNIKVKKLLALGNRYAMLLTVGSVLYSSTLVIVDIITGKITGTHTVPHSKMTTPDGAQLVVGDVEWLDGLGMHLPTPSHPQSDAQTEVTDSVMNAGAIVGTEPKPVGKGCCTEVSESCMNTTPQGIEKSDFRDNSVSCSKRSNELDGCCSKHSEGSKSIGNQMCVDLRCFVHRDSDYRKNKCVTQESISLVMNNLPLHVQSEQIEQSSFLVLAAGVLNEPGRLFTLWWAQSRYTQKCKKE